MKITTILKIGKLIFGTKDELIESLFKPVEGRTLDGVYKKRKNGIALNHGNGEPWIFLISNRWGERFFVSACRHTSGKEFYFHGLDSDDADRIGLSYSERQECARDVWEKFNS